MFRENLISAILTFLFSLILWVIQYLSQKKAKLVYYYGGMSNFSLKPQEQGKQPMNIYTHSLILSNVGKAPAEKVEIYQNTVPLGFSITPDIKWTVSPNASEQFKHVIEIEYLEPRGQIMLSYLYGPPQFPQNFVSKIRCKDGEGKQIPVLPVRQFSPLVNYLFQFIFLVGAIAIIYLITKYVLVRLFGLF